MKLLSGKLIAEKIYATLEKKVADLDTKGVKPKLAVIMVGSDPASELYVNKKSNKAKEVGIEIYVCRMPYTTNTKKAVDQILQFNSDPTIHGIIVQLPLPRYIDTGKVIWAIDPKKDVDGFQMRDFRPPTPLAILEILMHYSIPVLKSKITLVGYGTLVNKPLAMLLNKQGADITVCTEETPDRIAKIKRADIIVSAVGQAGIITQDMVREGQIVIDAGTSSEGGSTKGDVVFDEVAPIVSAITPVPGGVGPLTVVKLLENVIEAATRQTSFLEKASTEK